MDADLAERLDALLRRRGTSRIEGYQRIFRWFLDQVPTIQVGVLDQLPEDIAPDIARMVLTRMAGETATPEGKAATLDAKTRRSEPAPAGKRSTSR